MRQVKNINQQVHAAYPANENPKQEFIKPRGNKNKSTKSLKSLKSNKSKNKAKANIFQHESDETLQNGMVNHHNRDPLDDKSTIRKKSFESKPIIKDLIQRIHKFSKQYTPEYFAQILEYTIEKQMKNSLAITADKITKYRKFISDKRKAEAKVRRQMNKMKEVIETNSKRFVQRNQKQTKIQKIYYDDDSQSPTKGNSSKKHFSYCLDQQKQEYGQHYQLYSQQQSSQSNRSCKQRLWETSTFSEQSSPNSTFSQSGQQIYVLTQSSLQNEWNSKYEQYICLIDTIYALLGQNECKNSIFPACYIFFSLVVSNQKTFKALQNTYFQQIDSTNNYPSQNNDCFANGSILSKCSPKQMIEYYIIVSLLISTKYHDIYPVSAEELIQSLNFTLSMEKVMKIQCDVLEMYDFCQYFDENQQKFLRMFIVVVGWKQEDQNVCQFILQSGLSNPKLFKYSPLFKAATVMGFYEQKIMKKQQKFMIVKNLCPGMSIPLANEIKKLYSEIIIYHHRNKFTETLKKYYIFDNQLTTLSKK